MMRPGSGSSGSSGSSGRPLSQASTGSSSSGVASSSPTTTTVCCCCKLRTFVIWLGLSFVAVQAVVLAAALTAMAMGPGLEAHVGHGLDWFRQATSAAKEPHLLDGDDVQAFNGEEEQFQSFRREMIRRARDFIAIPITLCIILMISDSLLIWAAVSGHKILLWPWLALHGLEWAVLVAGLIYLMVVVVPAYAKVLLFLSVCPFLVIFAFCWIVVKAFYNYLRDLNVKEAVAAVYNSAFKNPSSSSGGAITQYPTMYSAEPKSHHQHWDQPPPIWASANAQQVLVWDPNYIQKLDPRYQAQNPYAQAQQQRAPSSAASSYYGVLGSIHVRPPRPASSHGSRSHQSRRRKVVTTPTRLPDGTLVVPIADDTSSDDPDELRDIAEEEEESSNASRSKASGVTISSLSDKYSKPSRSAAPAAPAAGSGGAASSVITLSDKFRQTDEASEAFAAAAEPDEEEFYPAQPPPKPVHPPPGSRFFGGARVGAGGAFEAEEAAAAVSVVRVDPGPSRTSITKITKEDQVARC